MRLYGQLGPNSFAVQIEQASVVPGVYGVGSLVRCIRRYQMKTVASMWLRNSKDIHLPGGHET